VTSGRYPYGSPGAALEAHLRRLSAVETASPLAVRATETLLKSISRRLHGGAESMLRQESIILNRAVTHYVSPDLVDLALNDDRPPRPLDVVEYGLPSCGIAFFGKPVVISGYPEGGLRMAACAWQVTRVSITRLDLSGNEVVPGGDIEPDPNDPDAILVPGVVLLCYLSIADAEPFLLDSPPADPADRHAREEMKGGLDLLRGLGDLAMYDVQGWADGTHWHEGAEDLFVNGERAEPSGAVRPVVAQLRLFLQAFWSLLNEHIVVGERPEFDRPTRRRLARFGRSLEEDGGIKVLRLRRVDYPHGSEPRPSDAGWTLDHRIIVREYYKRVRYKDANGDWCWRRMKIAPHVRGPADAPLILKHNLTTVTR